MEEIKLPDAAGLSASLLLRRREEGESYENWPFLALDRTVQETNGQFLGIHKRQKRQIIYIEIKKPTEPTRTN